MLDVVLGFKASLARLPSIVFLCVLIGGMGSPCNNSPVRLGGRHFYSIIKMGVVIQLGQNQNLYWASLSRLGYMSKRQHFSQVF
jgi:hypothetical protein